MKRKGISSRRCNSRPQMPTTALTTSISSEKSNRAGPSLQGGTLTKEICEDVKPSRGMRAAKLCRFYARPFSNHSKMRCLWLGLLYGGFRHGSGRGQRGSESRADQVERAGQACAALPVDQERTGLRGARL